MIIPWQLALLWHGLHERLGEVEDVALDQALDDLQQLLDHHGDALKIPKLTTH